MAQICFFNTFHPVGQGLFHSGALYYDGRAKFVWVYDCGTTSAQALIDNAIMNLKSQVGVHTIDLLTISHFDKDHISGIVRLISQFKVKTLLLPYSTLARRIYLALATKINADDPAFEFLLNPANFLASVEGPGIDQVVFVAPSTQGPPPPPTDINVPDGPDDFEHSWGFRNLTPRIEDESLAVDRARRTKVQSLNSGGSLNVANLWEFVPYNDNPPVPVLPGFEQRVFTLKQKLLTPSRGNDRKAALTELKNAYDSFGTTAFHRNVISLFLYGGPLHNLWQSIRWPNKSTESGWPGTTTKCGILCTGDGYLDKPDRMDQLVNYLTIERMKRLGVFQVMHHGAKGNWYSGLAARIDAHTSVFSSDPCRRNPHPHREVWNDFSPFGAVQVDKKNALFFSGLLNR